MNNVQKKVRQVLKDETLREAEEWREIFTAISATMATAGLMGVLGRAAYQKYVSDTFRKMKEAKDAADRYRRLRSMIVICVEENIGKLTKAEIVGLMKISSQRLSFEEIEKTLNTLLEKKPKILDDILKRADPDGYAEMIKAQFPLDGKTVTNDELAGILAPELQVPPEPKPVRTRKSKAGENDPEDDIPVDPKIIN